MSVDSKIAKIKSAKSAGKFHPFIDFIQFPKYRNFKKDMRVSFDFPITVIVGQNGTGKSSLLQALSGAPKGKSPGNWWFGTPLDPTDDFGLLDEGRKNLPAKDRAAFWYGFNDKNGNPKRVVKSRIKRAGDPDYWEPSRPIYEYGIEGKERHNPIDMESIYLNFKTQINAFDRCFYFSSNNHRLLNKVGGMKSWKNAQEKLPKTRKRRPRIQDYLRIRSDYLRKVLVEKRNVGFGKTKMHEECVNLSSEELSVIGNIIGRKYTCGKILKHRFYETWGISVLFKTNELTYSEAFAGSGESAVARLVHEIHTSSNGCLILLDEPETSLHPGAQEELIKYLLKMTLSKKLQIVISTHSPAIVRNLPSEAIRVFNLESNDKVGVIADTSAHEAFHFIGHPPEDVVQLFVEDKASKAVIDSVLNTIGESFKSQFKVVFGHGGDSGMKLDAAILMLHKNSKQYFLFDGDVADSVKAYDTQSITINTTSQEIDDGILSHYGLKIKFREDSNQTDMEKRETRVNYVKYANKYFKSLPYQTPEEAIWNDDVAMKILESVSLEDEFSSIENEPCYKKKFDILTKHIKSTSQTITAQDIHSTHRIFLTRFCIDQNDLFNSIKNLLVELVDND